MNFKLQVCFISKVFLERIEAYLIVYFYCYDQKLLNSEALIVTLKN